MSWLDDLSKERIFNYKLEDGSTTSGTIQELSKLFNREFIGEPGEVILTDGLTLTYAGFEPIKLGQKGIVEFNKNGRKAVMVRNADGSIEYHSKTKLLYHQTGRSEQQFDDDYKKELERQTQQQLLREKHTPKQADPLKEMIRNLPEGEYLSDGKSFTPVENYEEPNVRK